MSHSSFVVPTSPLFSFQQMFTPWLDWRGALMRVDVHVAIHVGVFRIAANA
jgi:hypothetical protein